jgi:transposase, IS30 family
MAHHHFTSSERLEISILLKKGYSHRDIARELGCSQPSISREIKRNRVRKRYDPRQAKVKARQRRRYSKYQGMKVREHPDLQTFIIRKMKAGWTPDEIAGRLKTKRQDLPYISAKGIYKWLYSVHGQQYCPLLCSRQLKPKKRRPKAERSMIPHRVGIEKRSEEAKNRTEYGHAETDTAVSGKRHDSTHSLAVLHERKARYVRLRKIPNMKPKSMTRALKKMMKDVKLSTLTYDNGIENRDHETVAAALKIKTYFCNPYHSWEKGGVENTIGRIRRYIPKGSNIADFSDSDIAKIEHWLNHTPRKCLNWSTPYEIMIENQLFVSSPSPNPTDAFEG